MPSGRIQETARKAEAKARADEKREVTERLVAKGYRKGKLRNLSVDQAPGLRGSAQYQGHRVNPTETYTTMDRSRWGSGPWDDEPDKVVWVDETTGLDAIAVRGPIGNWCGYVGVGPGHPWYEMGYTECFQIVPCGDFFCEHAPESLVSAHGGLTFADRCDKGGDPRSSICHLGDEDRWWFGFDTAHAWDLSPTIDIPVFEDSAYRTLNYVVDEVTSLAEQIKAVVGGQGS